jgi:hypothetical protein
VAVLAAVTALVGLDGARRRRPGPHTGHVLEEGGHVLRRPEVDEAQGQELLALVAVMAEGGLVDGQEAERVQVHDPHGLWVGLKSIQ